MEQDIKISILKFIFNFKRKMTQEVEDIFMNGNCYWFAKILQIRFSGDIYFNPDAVHFATMIGDNLYDISGLVTESTEWYNWDEFCVTNDVNATIQSCILMDV